MKRNVDSSDVLGETIELFIEYFRKFGHKPCCVSDLRLYLDLLDAEKKAELSARLIKDVGISSTSVPQSVSQLDFVKVRLKLSQRKQEFIFGIFCFYHFYQHFQWRA